MNQRVGLLSIAERVVTANHVPLWCSVNQRIGCCIVERHAFKNQRSRDRKGKCAHSAMCRKRWTAR